MSSFWWVDAGRNRQGPVDAVDAIGLVKTGQILPDTLVWTQGMPAWTAAKDAPGLGDQFRAPEPPPLARQPQPFAPPPPPSRGQFAPPASLQSVGVNGPLQTSITAWGLFWRLLVVTFCSMFIIPAPWMTAMYSRYLVSTTQGPDGRAFEFGGKGGDIWWMFIVLIPALFLVQVLMAMAIGQNNSALLALDLLSLVVMSVISFLLLRWFVAKSHPYGHTLEFKGEFLPFIGVWLVYILLSIIPFAGAWGVRYFIAWTCRNVSGPLRFEFRGTGLEILWRGLVAALGSCLIVTIPWLMAWLYRWTVSQIYVSEA